MVELLTHTPNPEEVLKVAYSECYQKDIVIETVVKHLKHSSVLEHVSYTFKIQISRACLAQLTRHRIASYTVESQRYVDYQNGFNYYIPQAIIENKNILQEYMRTMNILIEQYGKLRELGIKKEDARMILPQATMCNLTFTMNLRSLINFWQLRLSSHAQAEIRELAQKTLDLTLDTLPNLKEPLMKLIKEGY